MTSIIQLLGNLSLLLSIFYAPIFNISFQSTSRFENREELMAEMEQYGGIFDCQRFRDVMIYSLSVFTFALPQAMEVLAEAVWRPRLTEEEVGGNPLVDCITSLFCTCSWRWRGSRWLSSWRMFSMTPTLNPL